MHLASRSCPSVPAFDGGVKCHRGGSHWWRSSGGVAARQLGDEAARAAILGKRVLTLNGEFSEQSVGEGEEADSHAAEAVVALLPQG